MQVACAQLFIAKLILGSSCGLKSEVIDVDAFCQGQMCCYSRLTANGLLDWFGLRLVASLRAISLLLTLSRRDSSSGIESRIAEML